MKKQTSKPADPKAAAASPTPPVPIEPAIRRLYRPLDWITFGLTTILVFIGYYLTLAPDVTLEDSGELAVGSFYAGVPHPPGYPFWALYTWLFTNIPISNIAWRVGLSSAVAGALACGLLGMMVSRGSSMILEGLLARERERAMKLAKDFIPFQDLPANAESAISLISGTVAGMLFGFTGFFWSQSVIVEVYSLSVLTFVAVLCCLFRWIYVPTQRRYLYWAFFWFGICFTNHQTLLLAAVGLEVAILAVQPKVGFDLFFWNSVIYVGGLFLKQKGLIKTFDSNEAMFVIYNIVGIGSIITACWTSIVLKFGAAIWKALFRDLLLLAGLGFLLALVMIQSEVVTGLNRRGTGFQVLVVGGLAVIAVCARMVLATAKNQPKSRWTPPKPILWGAAAYVAYLILGTFWSPAPLSRNVNAFFAVHLVGWLLLAAFVYSAARAKDLGSEISLAVGAGVAWVAGVSFYLYMPITSMSNPPMNWGYPRTVQGFFHALTRGQYDQAHPTSEFWPFVGQVMRYGLDAIQEFSLLAIVVGLIPFVFLLRMPKRERGWIIGLTAIWATLTVFLLVLLNPGSDMQSRQLNRVFFTSTHIMVAMGIGYGLALLGGVLCSAYRQNRIPLLWGGIVALVIEGIIFLNAETPIPTIRAASILGLSLVALFVLALVVCRSKAVLPVFLAIMAVMPLRAVLANWYENEQRGHRFGYWFGHDMFTPPWAYPPMARDAVLFGGTDPGRFNPTYMIFCESFIPPKNKPLDPEFDRRDVYLITQNALADGTYLDYIRAHYNRSAQKDPYFFSELARKGQEGTNLFSKALVPLDRYFTDLGAGIEKRRRAEGVYPPAEIHTPTPTELGQSYADYTGDAQRRYLHDQDPQKQSEPRQMRPGEQITSVGNNQVQVSGQVAVMSINGLLTKVIFDQNPGHEFYVEESFPLDWMFPYLTPFGIIMKINRQEMLELPLEALDRDRAFWTKYPERFIGTWVTDQTTPKELADFVEKTYLRHDLTGFQGDPAWIRDTVAQKAFSKLRSAIAGIYCYRLGWDANGLQTPQKYHAKSAEQKKRLLTEAEFALKQSYAFCPASPEALSKYVHLLVNTGRASDALLLAETSLKFDPENGTFKYFQERLRQLVPPPAVAVAVPDEIKRLEQQFRQSPSNSVLALQVAEGLTKAKQNESAAAILDMALNVNNSIDLGTLVKFAERYTDLGQTARVNDVMSRVGRVIGGLQTEFSANTNDVNKAFALLSAYLFVQQRQDALDLVKDLSTRTNSEGDTIFTIAKDPQKSLLGLEALTDVGNTIYTIAKIYERFAMWPEMEATLDRLVQLMPGFPDSYFDLAIARSAQGKTEPALSALRGGIAFSNQRLAREPKARDLRAEAKSDPRLANVRQLPGFQELVK